MRRIISWLGLALVFACGSEDPPNETTKPGAKTKGPTVEESDPRSAVSAAAVPTGERIDEHAARVLVEAREKAERRLEEVPPLTQTYRHDLGFYFHYPEGWELKQLEEGVLSLTPPDLHRIAGEPGEAILVMGDDAEGLKRPQDPRAVKALDKLIRSMFPFLKKEDEVETRRYPKHSGIVLTWAGKSPSGVKCRARAWATIMKDSAIGILALTPEDRLEERAAVCEDMFATFGFTKPKADTRLLGQWRYEKVYMSGSFSTVTSEYMILLEDGTCLSGSKLFASDTYTDSGGHWTGSSTASSGGAEYRGRWRTSGKSIVLSWENAAEETWQYYAEGNSMLFKVEGSKEKKLWERVR